MIGCEGHQGVIMMMFANSCKRRQRVAEPNSPPHIEKITLDQKAGISLRRVPD